MGTDRSNIDNIYPVTPVGEALLLSRIQSAPADPGLLHVALRLEGEVDPESLKTAWQLVTDRHEALRSSVHWKKSRQTMQVVRKHVESSFVCKQLSQSELGEFRKNDWSRGVDMTSAPIDRLALLSASSNNHVLLWTTHHILLDGWSAAIILEELLSCYAATRRGAMPNLAPTPRRDRYESWLAGRDTSVAEEFWSDYLRGFKKPVDISSRRRSGSLSFPFPAKTIELLDDQQRQISNLVKTTECTLGQILQIGLAVCLARVTSEDDIVFGMTASGRPAEVPHIDRMTGLFTSTLPVRLTLDRSLTVRETALKLRAQQVGATQHGFVSPDRIVELSEIPIGRALFDCILIVENFPWREILEVEDVGFSIKGFKGSLTTTLPITVTAAETDGLELQILYDPGLFDEEDADSFAGTLKEALVATTVDPERSLGDVMESVQSGTPDRVLREVADVQPAAADESHDMAAALPIDDIELSLARIWSDVLGIRPISRHDDFFELGGRSLQAVQVFNRIERQLGKKLPISAIFDGRTVAGMADVIRGDEKRTPWKSLVPIQPYGSRPPIFGVHARNGNVNYYYDLARRLGPDQPFYGIQSVGLNGEDPLTSVPQMAAQYASEILSLQGDAPCIVTGFCFGTTIMVELVHQIAALGGRVDLLIALDTGPFDPGLGATKPQPTTGIRIAKVLARVGKRLHRGRIKMFSTQRQKWNHAVVQANLEAIYSYTARSVKTPVLFVRSSEFQERENKAMHLDRWNGLAQAGLEVAEIESKHITLLTEPHVRLLADTINQHIEKLYQSPG